MKKTLRTGLPAAVSAVFFALALAVTGCPGPYNGPHNGGENGPGEPPRAAADQLDELWAMAERPAQYTVNVGLAREYLPRRILTSTTPVAVTIRGTGTQVLALEGVGAMFVIGANVTLILENIELHGVANNNSALVSIAGGNLVMRSGAVITGNTNSGNGGGVNVTPGSRFDMYGGEIFGNSSGGSGGGVQVTGSAANPAYFYLHDGSVRNNRAANGGGISNAGFGALRMNGGTVRGNTAAGAGGGVFTVGEGYFTMRGGAIAGNTAEGNVGGAGVNVSTGGRFFMHAGIVYGSNGGPVNRNIGIGAALNIVTGAVTYITPLSPDHSVADPEHEGWYITGQAFNTVEAVNGDLVQQGNAAGITLTGIPGVYIGRGLGAVFFVFRGNDFIPVAVQNLPSHPLLTTANFSLPQGMVEGNWLLEVDIMDGANNVVATYRLESSLTPGSNTIPFASMTPVPLVQALQQSLR